MPGQEYSIFNHHCMTQNIKNNDIYYFAAFSIIFVILFQPGFLMTGPGGARQVAVLVPGPAYSFLTIIGDSSHHPEFLK